VPRKTPRTTTAPLDVPADLQNLQGPHLAWTSASKQHGEQNQLWCADALVFLQQQPTQSVDLVVADPPYAIGKADWDTFATPEQYLQWCDEWIAQAHRILKPTGSLYVLCLSEILADIKAISAKRFDSCKWLVWHYRNKANLGNDWGRSHESILHLRGADFALRTDAVRVPYNAHTSRYPQREQSTSSHFAKPGKKADTWQPHPLGAKPRDVFEVPILCNGMAEKTAHLTQKPESLITSLIAGASDVAQTIIDPFVGSGTTAAVAQKLGRHFIVADREPAILNIPR